jgi:hypothetical protein
MSNFVKTIDNSSLLENAIQLALQPYASMNYVASYVSASLQGLATSASVSTSIANSLVQYSTTALMNSAIATAVQPMLTTSSLTSYSTTALMNTAITNATRPLAPLTYVVSYVSNALLPYGKTVDINSAIATSLAPYSTTTDVSSSIATSLAPYSTTTATNAAITTSLAPYSTTTATNAAITTSLAPYSTTTATNAAIASSSLISLTNIWTGANTFRGVCNAIQSADTILPVIFSATPSFSMTTGMVYNMSTTATVLTSLAFTAIPTTPQQTYVFSFVLLPTTNSSSWYLRPPTNFISITPLGGALLTAPIYGISSVVFPTSYTYIVQTITIVNTSTTTSPTFISFLSVSGY